MGPQSRIVAGHAGRAFAYAGTSNSSIVPERSASTSVRIRALRSRWPIFATSLLEACEVVSSIADTRYSKKLKVSSIVALLSVGRPCHLPGANLHAFAACAAATSNFCDPELRSTWISSVFPVARILNANRVVPSISVRAHCIGYAGRSHRTIRGVPVGAFTSSATGCVSMMGPNSDGVGQGSPVIGQMSTRGKCQTRSGYGKTSATDGCHGLDSIARIGSGTRFFARAGLIIGGPSMPIRV